MVKAVEQKGNALKAQLSSLQHRFPSIMKEVRGRGFLLGIEFHVPNHPVENNLWCGSNPHFLLGIMSQQTILAAVISSYMLNVERIRLAPTLNSSNTLRVEPALVATQDMCNQMVQSLSQALSNTQRYGSVSLLLHLVANPSNKRFSDPVDHTLSSKHHAAQFKQPHAVFIVNPETPSHYAMLDSSLIILNELEMELLAPLLGELLEPFVLGRLESSEFSVSVMCVPRTNRELQGMDEQQLIKELGTCIQLAKELVEPSRAICIGGMLHSRIQHMKLEGIEKMSPQDPTHSSLSNFLQNVDPLQENLLKNFKFVQDYSVFRLQ